MARIWSWGTGSSQTVCQMPETAVYQMLLGSRTCFPRSCQWLSVGSQTATTSSLLFARTDLAR